MADNKAMQDAQGAVQRRVKQSEALLERMDITPEAYERVVLNALVRNPQLSECDRNSMDVAVADCIQAGLVPDGREAAIIPFKGRNDPKATATFIPMIEGKLKLARRATPGLAIRVRVVYEDDTFEYRDGLRVKLDHDINPMADRRDEKIIAAYAVAETPLSSTPQFEVFYRSTIEIYRGYSRARNGRGPWDTHYAEMAKKAVLGQLLKRLGKAVGAPPEPEGLPLALTEGLDFGGDPMDEIDLVETHGVEPVTPDANEPEPQEQPAPRRRRAPAQQQTLAPEPPEPPEPPPPADDDEEGQWEEGEAPF